MYYLEAEQGNNKRMRNALMLAFGAHIVLAAAVSFDIESGPSYNPQIEVTLATRPNTRAPDDARHIAQSSQEGSGSEADMEAVTSSNNETPIQAANPQQAAPLEMTDNARSDADLLSTAAAAPRMINDEQSEKDLKKNLIPGLNPEVDRLNEQLSSLEAELDEQTRAYSDRPRVRRLTSIATRESADAAYLHSFLKRLEAVGNKYYPEASIRYGLYGSLRLLVIVRQDGSLEDIRVLQSSGFAVLDEAAIKTVRMGAPFAPFPAELAATTDKLEIIRTWHFEENELSSNNAPANLQSQEIPSQQPR